MPYTEAELKANSNETSFLFRPNTIGYTADKQLPIRNLMKVASDHNSNKHNIFIVLTN